MQLYFIRHAQSANNALWDQVGSGQGRSADPGLTETGLKQAEILAAYLSRPGPGAPDGQEIQNQDGFALTHLYSSLMVRAVATGAILSQALGLPLVAWPDLHEGGGVYLNDEDSGEPTGLPGNPRSFFEANYPALTLPPELGEDGWWNRPYETRPERRARARRLLAELRQRHGNDHDRVAVVSHGGFFNHFMAVLLHLPDPAADIPGAPAAQNPAADLPGGPLPWFTMSNAAIARFDFTPDEIKVSYLNRANFLPGELVT
ncbi:MAG: histidine phosphatase family protein [Chloroflexota bacterium]